MYAFKSEVLLQLDFADFDLEESERCLYDSLTVLGDIGGHQEIGKMNELDCVSLK